MDRHGNRGGIDRKKFKIGFDKQKEEIKTPIKNMW